MWNGALLENSLEMQAKHWVIIWPRNSTPKDTPQRNEDNYTQKTTDTSVHNSVIHNSEKVEKIQMSINWLMAKQNVVYPYNCLFSYIEMKYGFMLQHDEPWKYYGKYCGKVRHSRPHIIWFSLCKMYRIGKSLEAKID